MTNALENTPQTELVRDHEVEVDWTSLSVTAQSVLESLAKQQTKDDGVEIEPCEEGEIKEAHQTGSDTREGVSIR